jgi:hypothetical protein
MTGLVPAIHAPGLAVAQTVQLVARGHVFLRIDEEIVDARHKAGHDDVDVSVS